MLLITFLKTWFDDEINKTRASETMCKALENIGKKVIIKEVML